jgi:hypothetical protein
VCVPINQPGNIRQVAQDGPLNSAPAGSGVVMKAWRFFHLPARTRGKIGATDNQRADSTTAEAAPDCKTGRSGVHSSAGCLPGFP